MSEPRALPPDGPEDELSLQPLVETLWLYRRVMLVAFAVTMIAAAAIILVMYGTALRERIVSVGVRLTFDGADQDTFPNGPRFSSTEIVGTPVLAEVHRKNALGQ